MKRTLSHFWIRIHATINIAVFLIASNSYADDHNLASQIELQINDTEVAFTVYSSTKYSTKQNNDLILWFPSEHGLPESTLSIAKTLSQYPAHSEVWVADILSSLFLPVQTSSINKVPNDFLYNLIKKVQLKTNKRIFVVSSGRGALLAMRASHYWLQDSLRGDQFGGLILLYPNLFTKTPEPGTPAKYYPVTRAVNVPIFILQPENSPWRWQLAALQQHLITGKARPYISILPDVRDRFFFRPDATTQEHLASKSLAAVIHNAIAYLNTEKIAQYSIPAKLENSQKKNVAKQQAKLVAYTKNPKPAPLKLNLLSGQKTSLEQHLGKVIVVNFWASWCPPCVHEMPSMEKLYLRYPKSDFTILAVNMAEDTATINDFIQNRVKISFPVLLDHDGKALKDWQVFAFPSSYVIGKQGKIRYALFGSILWDTPEVIEIIDKLISEKTRL